MTISLSVFAGQKYEFELNGSFKEITKTLPDKSSFSSLNTFGAFSDNRGNIGKYECDGIREAFKNGDIHFNKPISCHLFPVRITNYETFDALNIEKLKICSSGFICGKSKKVPLYKFLKNALIRKYGKDWYKKLDEIAKII